MYLIVSHIMFRFRGYCRSKTDSFNVRSGSKVAGRCVPLFPWRLICAVQFEYFFRIGYHSSGGCKEGAGTRVAPLGTISFIFMQFLLKKIRQILFFSPISGVGTSPPIWVYLDLPLYSLHHTFIGMNSSFW